MFRFLLADETFRTLNIPISPASRKEMERKIRKGESVEPIISWKGYIVTGYEQDDLYLKYHRSVHTKEMFFHRKSDAVAWLCQQQLKRTDLIWAAKAWLISRLYEALREVANRQVAREEFQYRQLSPSSHTNEYFGQPKENSAILKQLGSDYNYHKETIRRYVRFGRQLDELEVMIPGIRIRILTGELEVLIRYMPALLKMPVEDLKEMVDNKNCKTLIPPSEFFVKTEAKKNDHQKTSIHVEPGIKQMPEFDPDAELNGLRYTIPAWKKAILRTAIRTDFSRTTDFGKESLKQALCELITEAQCLGRILEGKQND